MVDQDQPGDRFRGPTTQIGDGQNPSNQDQWALAVDMVAMTPLHRMRQTELC